jgi:TrmH family RNA methyltransferase
MLSKSQISLIKSLHLKKFRKTHNLFIVEGVKSITEFINEEYVLHSIYYLPEMSSKVVNFLRNMKGNEISSDELKKISALTNPQGVLAVFKIPHNDLKVEYLKGKFSFALDFIQDPGNLGTIIRTADWFGMDTLICSMDTADIYNPKVIQASMGSLARVKVFYCDLKEWLPECKFKIYGAVLDGESIYESNFGDEGIILLGNEGSGIQSDLIPLISERITIPRFGGAESLNVAISSAIICSELSRKIKKT